MLPITTSNVTPSAGVQLSSTVVPDFSSVRNGEPAIVGHPSSTTSSQLSSIALQTSVAPGFTSARRSSQSSEDATCPAGCEHASTSTPTAPNPSPSASGCHVPGDAHDARQRPAPVLSIALLLELPPPKTSISEPVQAAPCPLRALGEFGDGSSAVHVFDTGS
jgi:hypothetical protein